MRWVGPTQIVGSPYLYDKIVGTIIIFIAFAGDALTGGGGNYGGGWIFLGVVLGVLSVVLVILAALTVALVAQTFLRLLPMGLVWYRFFDSLFVHLSFTLTPISAERVEFRDIGTTVSLLMHSAIYNDERALRASSRSFRAIPVNKCRLRRNALCPVCSPAQETQHTLRQGRGILMDVTPSMLRVSRAERSGSRSVNSCGGISRTGNQSAVSPWHAASRQCGDNFTLAQVPRTSFTALHNGIR
jgi:hypothetical protein